MFLKSGGIPFREEVYIYTFLDFVGNVGGFLGVATDADTTTSLTIGDNVRPGPLLGCRAIGRGIPPSSKPWCLLGWPNQHKRSEFLDGF